MAMGLHTTSGSFIFHGNNPSALARAAIEQVRAANCLGDDQGQCANCKQVLSGNYPDLITLRNDGKPSINLEQVRGVLATLGLALYRAGGLRAVVIDGAHQLTPEAQNALLKALEEPPVSTIFILATTTPQALLPTVRSRCAMVFVPDPAEAGANELTDALGLTPFERLLLAKRLVDAKLDLPAAATALHQAVARNLRDGSTNAATAARQLDALEIFRRQLSAKVGPRVALERLMLEL